MFEIGGISTCLNNSNLRLIKISRIIGQIFGIDRGRFSLTHSFGWLWNMASRNYRHCFIVLYRPNAYFDTLNHLGVTYTSVTVIHSFIGPLDRWWVVVPSILLDHWLCPMRHQWRVLCRLPVVASTDGEAGHVDVSTASCCRGGDQFLSWQSDADCSAMWAGVTSGSRVTWPNIAWRRLVILSRTLSWPVRFMMVALVAKSYTDSEYTSLAWHVECLELLFFRFQQCPGLCTVQKDRDNKGIVQPQLCGQTQLFLSPDIRKLAHYAWRMSDSPMYFRSWPTWWTDCTAETCELVRSFDRLPLYVNW